MCGVAGGFSFGLAADPIDSTIVRRLNDLQRRRGPDGVGLWSSDNSRIVLGHRRLAIIDKSLGGAQPMSDSSGRWTISFNGEIYNYRALKFELEHLGCIFLNNSDTEVLINVIAQWGEEGLKKLRGMYAFALWDSFEKELWLVRDPFGIKPLYVAQSAGTIWFASQARPLAACAPVATHRDPAALTGFYLWGYVPEPFSWWAGIRMFPPGHVQRIRVGGQLAAPQEFCRIEHQFSKHTSTPLKTGELRQLLSDSVEHHLISDVPIGVFLSAGIDSRVIATLASQHTKSLNTLTLGFREYIGKSKDEVPVAEAVARNLKSNHATVRIGHDEFFDLLDDFLLSMDQPTTDGLNTYLVSRAAASQGLKVAISGLGGDELFGGYPSFHQIPQLLKWNRLAPSWLARALERALLAASPPLLPPKSAGLLSHSGNVASAYLLRRSLYLEGELPLLVDADVLQQGIEQLSSVSNLAATVEPLAGKSVHAQVSALELCWYMRNQLLRDTDWASLAHGLEVRVPFVDIKVLERLGPLIASNAPPEKNDLAECASFSDLPLGRPKTGFTTPVKEWTASLGQPATRGLRGWAGIVAGQFGTEVDLADRPAHICRSTLSENERTGAIKVRAPEETILIFRIGSIGDTVIALPCFHRIASLFPNARRIVLTNKPVSVKAAPLESVIGNSGLIDGVIHFSPGTRSLRELLRLRDRIRETGARTLIYLSPRSRFGAMRDVSFFRLCGIRRIIGAPLARDMAEARIDRTTGVSEREAERLARCLTPLGIIDVRDRKLWDLRLLPDEIETADKLLIPLGCANFIAVNIGGKVPSNNWGDSNWTKLLRLIASKYADCALIFFGSEDEFRRSARIAADWPGPKLNLCGKLTPRESAAVIRRAISFVGHDSGPMHLSAAVGTPCVAMFGDFNPPNKWHPFGTEHRLIHNMRGVQKISPEEVYTAISSVIDDCASSVISCTKMTAK